MTALEWDTIGDRIYETGVDRGVIYYPPYGLTIPWSGLISVTESTDKRFDPTYYDGIKINNFVSFGEFSGVIKAITYPSDFPQLEGYSTVKEGFFICDQEPVLFHLSYRTKLGNDLSDNAGYKIHILYNVKAIPRDRTYLSINSEVDLSEFEWDITVSPEQVPGFRPTAHFIINSLDVDPYSLEEFETLLYGNDIVDPSLPSFSDLVDYFKFEIAITDNGDGTWTASSLTENAIEFITSDQFQINNANAIYLDADTYEISNS